MIYKYVDRYFYYTYIVVATFRFRMKIKKRVMHFDFSNFTYYYLDYQLGQIWKRHHHIITFFLKKSHSKSAMK